MMPTTRKPRLSAREAEAKMDRLARALAVAQIGLEGMAESLESAKLFHDARAAREILEMSRKAEMEGKS